jgi:hypothetical protein
MDENILQRVMDLAERTGDRVIVVNPRSGKAHAVLPFDAYEKLADGRASLLDLVDDEYDPLFENEFADDLAGPVADEDKAMEEIAEIEKIVQEELSRESSEKVKKDEKDGKIDIEAVNKELAEESQKISENPLPMDALDDQVGDDQYYVEPIE